MTEIIERTVGQLLTCKKCNRQWFWPRPFRKRKYISPENCPDCRKQEIEVLNKQIEELQKRIVQLTPDSREKYKK